MYWMRQSKKNKFNQLQADYQKALRDLKRDPSSMEHSQRCLNLGRSYHRLVSQQSRHSADPVGFRHTLPGALANQVLAQMDEKTIEERVKTDMEQAIK